LPRTDVRICVSRSGVFNRGAEITATRPPLRGGARRGFDSSRADAAVESILIAEAKGERGFKEGGGDFPARSLVGVGVAMGGDDGVHELEQSPRDPERAKGFD